jgi:hypothetical protein
MTQWRTQQHTCAVLKALHHRCTPREGCDMLPLLSLILPFAPPN